jgi:deazaflavin-dependent oxidoreductase (nitroreductase family)
MLDYKPQAEKSAFDKVLQAFAQTRVGGKLFITVFPEIDRRLMPLTRGRVSIAGPGGVLLHVRGAKSGVERTTPLLATKQGDLFVLIASKAGAAKHPAWFHNVRANPDVEVTLQGGDRVPMRATIAEGEERERLWAMAVDNYSGYERYQTRTGGRTIPVVALRPR